MTIVSSCPACGAPIYGPARIEPGDSVELRRTCACLPRLAPAVVQPAPIVVPAEPRSWEPVLLIVPFAGESPPDMIPVEWWVPLGLRETPGGWA